jgi:hypothetical protein
MLAGCINREGYRMFGSMMLIIVWVAIGMFGDICMPPRRYLQFLPFAGNPGVG